MKKSYTRLFLYRLGLIIQVGQEGGESVFGTANCNFVATFDPPAFMLLVGQTPAGFDQVGLLVNGDLESVEFFGRSLLTASKSNSLGIGSTTLARSLWSFPADKDLPGRPAEGGSDSRMSTTPSIPTNFRIPSSIS